MVGEERLKLGLNCTSSFLIVDAQSVKNTDTAMEKGYDAGKRVSGIKRHIAVDTQATQYFGNNSQCYRQRRCYKNVYNIQ